MGGPGQLQVVPRLAIGPITGGDEMPATIQLGATGVDVEAAAASPWPGDADLSATGPAVAWLQQVLAGSVIAPDWAAYAGPLDGIFGPQTDTALRSLQSVKGVTVDGIVSDQTWFAWLTPGTAQQLTLERACDLLERLGP